MDNRRQERVAHLLQETFAQVLRKEGSRFIDPKVMVTVTKVKVSPDLSIAHFFLSIFNTDQKMEVMNTIREHESELRYALGNELRHHLRKIPEMVFEVDDTMDYVEKMESVFKQIKGKGDSSEEE